MVTNVFWGAIDNGMHGNDNMDRVVPMKMIISMEPFLIFMKKSGKWKIVRILYWECFLRKMSSFVVWMEISIALKIHYAKPPYIFLFNNCCKSIRYMKGRSIKTWLKILDMVQKFTNSRSSRKMTGNTKERWFIS